MQLSVRQLTADEYPRWDALVAASPQRSIYAQRWWIDLVTAGQGQLLGCFDEGHLIAGLPIWPCITLGIPRLKQPPLTPYWGPLFSPVDENPYRQFFVDQAVSRELAQTLSDWQDVVLQCHPSVTNWLGFHWQGFAQTTRFTYRITDWNMVQLDRRKCNRALQAELNRAEKHHLVIEEMVEPERLIASRDTPEHPMPAHIRQLWPHLITQAYARMCLYTAMAVDADGQNHATLVMAWDDRCANIIHSGSDPRFRHSGGRALLHWHALHVARETVPTFDFHGSMLERVEPFLRQFGGEYTPYSLLTRSTSWQLNSARWLRQQLLTRPQKINSTAEESLKTTAM